MNDRLLRDVRLLDGYRLRTFDTYGHMSTGQRKLAYIFQAPGRRVLFKGADYGCAPADPIDSDAALVGLLGFLTLKPGDTDSEYFDRYTPEQLDWCRGSDCEELSLLVANAEDSEGEPIHFETWPS